MISGSTNRPNSSNPASLKAYSVSMMSNSSSSTTVSAFCSSFSTSSEYAVYAEFGLYVDKHGDPSRSSGIVEWEGTAERVALSSPYILLFDRRFIEIRHMESGRLAQIMLGNHIRCLWDGRGADASMVIRSSDDQDRMAQVAQVHAVISVSQPNAKPRSGIRPSRAVAQHVFKLIPIVPPYMP
jgi:RHO1 GDP-GTP exchange protein 1/2